MIGVLLLRHECPCPYLSSQPIAISSLAVVRVEYRIAFAYCLINALVVSSPRLLAAVLARRMPASFD